MQSADEAIVESSASSGAPATGTRRGRRGKKDNTSGKSPTQIAWARLKKDRVAMVCAVIVVFFVLMALLAPVLAGIEGQDPSTQHSNLVDTDGFPTIGPNSEHWLGVTPRIGRDVFARFVYGARPSLAIATLASVISTAIGLVMGMLAGFFGGWVDRVISWLIDFVLSLPFLLFAIAIVPIAQSWFGNPFTISQSTISTVRFFSLLFVLFFFFWAGLARLVRGEVLAMREREFVQAARALGVPTRRVLFKEMLPNLIGIIMVSLTTAIPGFIAAEAGLSYLGVGLVDPTPSWGGMVADAQNYFQADPLYLWVPVGALATLVLALSLLGDAVNDAFNPNTRR
ncbi:ABC transporter permease [Calidifontibacter sp. DB0510]|uniref:ABC transporter permease n=2 Tax=Metallococcus carri TaxID=1656884 RepID=A0A967EDT5_9MICO|nr:ABC transporter permease [Metallococcus carri]NOP37382.1 ABC transporter permease [Calidifontibacter sp. DB2511S]